MSHTLFQYRFSLSWLLTSIGYGLIAYLLFANSVEHASQTKQAKNATVNLTLSEFIPPSQESLPKPEPIKPKLDPKPETKKTIPIKPKKQPIKKKEPQKIVKKKSSSKQKVQKSSGNFNALMAEVRKRINQNKSYPSLAKRRGLQGKVTASFKVLANGKVNNITLKGSKAFHRSVRKAIQKAFPINPQKFNTSLPKEVTITLYYKLS
jgi:TonB family protein